MSQSIPQSPLTAEHRKQFEEEGYCILKSVIPERYLTILRDECQTFIDKMHADMDARGTDSLGISHRNRRYFVSLRHMESERVPEVVYSPFMASVAIDLLGPDVYLFFEQYVVKGTDKRSKFAWHQDSGYVGFDHPPYLTCWLALDDVSVENGTVYVLPYDRAPNGRDLVEHWQDPEMNDRVGYDGDDPGEPVIVPAGSIALFTSRTFHRSGPNLTNQMRRIYLLQYGKEPVIDPEGRFNGLNVPFVKNGEIVYDRDEAMRLAGPRDLPLG
ncbi:MAG: phytanoyl-CoA dioxygenase family protein [Opitutales bacterium]